LGRLCKLNRVVSSALANNRAYARFQFAAIERQGRAPVLYFTVILSRLRKIRQELMLANLWGSEAHVRGLYANSRDRGAPIGLDKMRTRRLRGRIARGRAPTGFREG